MNITMNITITIAISITRVLNRDIYFIRWAFIFFNTISIIIIIEEKELISVFSVERIKVESFSFIGETRDKLCNDKVIFVVEEEF